jgi:predicted amidohydrolase
MRIALIQLTVTDDPVVNLAATLGFVRQAHAQGAEFILTPECTNGLWSNRATQKALLRREEDDPTLAALRDEAAKLGVWLLIGSLALLTGDEDGRFANRSFLIRPDASIAARYDKIHMFDVNVSEAEVYRESAAFRPGSKAVVAQTPFAPVGMTVCYDVRFANLYRKLAQGGAQIITVPAAFNHITGAAHWETLLRARAIENGAFVLAPAQTGFHAEAGGKGRRTYGHSLAIAPWGEVLADGGTEPGVTLVDIDLTEVAKARGRVPSLQHDRGFDAP